MYIQYVNGVLQAKFVVHWIICQFLLYSWRNLLFILSNCITNFYFFLQNFDINIFYWIYGRKITNHLLLREVKSMKVEIRNKYNTEYNSRVVSYSKSPVSNPKTTRFQTPHLTIPTKNMDKGRLLLNSHITRIHTSPSSSISHPRPP